MAPDLLIRTARRRAELSQATLAERARMSQPEIARLERPGSNPTIQTLARVLMAAGQQLELAPLGNIDESQIIERLKLSHAERLATFTASQAGLSALRGAVQRG